MAIRHFHGNQHPRTQRLLMTIFYWGRAVLVIWDHCLARFPTQSGLEAPRNSLEITDELYELSRQNHSRCDDIPFAVEYPLVSGVREKSSYTPVRNNNFSRQKSPGVIARLMGLDTLPEASKTPMRPIQGRVGEVAELKLHKGTIPPHTDFSNASSKEVVRDTSFVPTFHHERLKSEDNVQMEVLPFRDHPQEKQLQEFKKTFEEARQAFQVKARLHPLKSLSADKSADAKWLEACADLNKSKEILDTLYFLQSNKKFFLKLLEEPQMVSSKALYKHQLDEGKTVGMLHMGKEQDEKANQSIVEKKREITSAQALSRRLIESKTSKRQTAANGMSDRESKSSKLASENMQIAACLEKYQNGQRTPLSPIKQKDKISSQTRVAVLKPNPGNLKGISSPLHHHGVGSSCTPGSEKMIGEHIGGLAYDESKREDEKLDAKPAFRIKMMDAQREPRVIAREIARRVRDAVKRELTKSRPSKRNFIPQAQNAKTIELPGVGGDVDDATKSSREPVTAPSTRRFARQAPNRVSASLPSSPRRSNLAEGGAPNHKKNVKAGLAEKSKDGKLFSLQGKKLVQPASTSHSMLNSRTRLQSKSCRASGREIKDCQYVEERATSSPIALTRSRSLPSSATRSEESLHDSKLHTKNSSSMADWPCTISETKTSIVTNGLSLKKEASSTASSKRKFAGLRLSLTMSKRKPVTQEAIRQNQQVPRDKTSVQRNLAECFEPLAHNCSNCESRTGKCLLNSCCSSPLDNIPDIDSGSCYFNAVPTESCSEAINQNKQLTSLLSSDLLEPLPESSPSKSCSNVEYPHQNHGNKIDDDEAPLDHQFKRAPGILSLNTSNDLSNAAEIGIEKLEQHSPVSVLESPFIEEIQSSIPELQDLCSRFNLLKLEGDGILETGIETVATESNTAIIQYKHATKSAPKCHGTDPKTQAPDCLINPPELSDHKRVWLEDVPCPQGKEQHMIYFKKIFYCSGLLLEPEYYEVVSKRLWSPDHVLDLSIPEIIEEQESQGLDDILQQHDQLSILDRRVLVDVVNECVLRKLRPQRSWIWPKSKTISCGSVIQTGKKLMQDTWTEICSYLDSQSSCYSLAEIDLNKGCGWMQVDEEVARITQQIEQQILKDLIKESILDLLSLCR
ncbi:hypothetical protein O6H91_15G057200 [Diphasiastrum complanatum]|uniref:Uncharacterized protein n=2 Tax=Diphasiastrum complanatum TaxID=34168 RepID=A0ACC2BIK9_DIPCM|nr:hypothetical protein O6H91_15G057200 [Diphasiastrum complanatum]KAJ7529561.1 hypothetical protein O6H91_15G057200 [Diphasiastrum complanatum]